MNESICALTFRQKRIHIYSSYLLYIRARIAAAASKIWAIAAAEPSSRLHSPGILLLCQNRLRGCSLSSLEAVRLSSHDIPEGYGISSL
jgi:hypothetical protein